MIDYEPQDLYNKNNYGYYDIDYDESYRILIDMGLSPDQVSRILFKYNQIAKDVQDEVYNITNVTHS